MVSRLAIASWKNAKTLSAMEIVRIHRRTPEQHKEA